MWDSRPWTLVATSAVAYSGVLATLRRSAPRDRNLRADIKNISSIHASVAAALAVLALSYKWDVSESDQSILPTTSEGERRRTNRLDDRGNVLIYGKSTIANAITSWETGYLIYDLGALIADAWPSDHGWPGGFAKALKKVSRKDPVFLGHHLLLIGALGTLQGYIARGRDRGMWVITAFFLAYASNPILHLRWQRRQATGRNNLAIDSLLAFVFAASRFGSVYWVLRTYAQHHGLGTWDAFSRQRRVCQTGTLTLVGLNAIWWTALLRGMASKSRKAK